MAAKEILAGGFQKKQTSKRNKKKIRMKGGGQRETATLGHAGDGGGGREKGCGGKGGRGFGAKRVRRPGKMKSILTGKKTEKQKGLARQKKRPRKEVGGEVSKSQAGKASDILLGNRKKNPQEERLEKDQKGSSQQKTGPPRKKKRVKNELAE